MCGRGTQHDSKAFSLSKRNEALATAEMEKAVMEHSSGELESSIADMLGWLSEIQVELLGSQLDMHLWSL